jgi:hypothetical protein
MYFFVFIYICEYVCVCKYIYVCVFSMWQGLEIISRDLDELIERGGTVDDTLACLAFLNKKQNRYENMLDLRAAVANANKHLDSRASEKCRFSRALSRAFMVELSAFFVSQACHVLQPHVRSPPAEAILLRILTAAKTPSRAMTHLRLLNESVRSGARAPFPVMEQLISAMQDISHEKLTQELLRPSLQLLLVPALAALPASSSPNSYIRSGVSMWREHKLLKPNHTLAHVCDALAMLAAPSSPHSDRKGPAEFRDFAGLCDAVMDSSDVVVQCIETMHVLPAGLYINTWMINDLVTAAGTPTHLIRVIKALGKRNQRYTTYGELEAEVRSAFAEVKHSLLKSSLIVNDRYPDVTQTVVLEDITELLYHGRHFENMVLYLEALQTDCFHFNTVQELIAFAAADTDRVRLLRANQPEHKLLPQLEAVRAAAGCMELVLHFLDSAECVLFGGRPVITPTHVRQLLDECEPSIARLYRRLKCVPSV